MGAGFSKLGQLIGGEVAEAFDKAGAVIDTFGARGEGAGKKLSAVGAAAAGAGFLLTTMGAHEKQATDQLNQAIANTGKATDGLNEEIEHAVKHMEHYGDTAVQTKTALTTLTNATHDPEKALQLLGTAADVAAVKHMSLDEAAGLVGKALNGSAKVFKQFGVQVKTNADGTKDYAGAVEELARVVHGQADTAADNFNGKLRRLRAEVEDNVAAFGQKYGPAITTAGVSMMVLGPVVGKTASLVKRMGTSFEEAGAEAQAGAAGVAEADAEIVASNEAAAASAGELAAAQGAAGGVGLAKFAAGATLVIGAAYGIGQALGKLTDANSMDDLNKQLQASASAAGDLTEQLVNNKYAFDQVGPNWARAQLEATGLSKKAAQAGISVDEMAHAVEDGSDAVASLADKWRDAGDPSGKTLIQLHDLAAAYDRAKEAAKRHAEQTKEDAAEAPPLIAGYHATQDAINAANDSIDKSRQSLAAQRLQMQLTGDAAGIMSDAFGRLNDKTLDVKGAELAARDAIAQMDDAVKSNGRSLDDNTAKGRANVETVLQAIRAAQAHGEAVAKQTGRVQAGERAYNSDVTALRKHLTALGLNKNQVDALIRSYGKVPKFTLTKAELQDLASAKISAIDRELQSMDGRTAYVNIVERTFGSGPGQVRETAGGSDFFPGGRTRIAEREPEIIDLPRGSTVTPLSRMSAPSQPVAVSVTVNYSTFVPDLVGQRILVGAIEDAVRNGLSIAGVTK